jgi:hypothetical protein
MGKLYFTTIVIHGSSILSGHRAAVLSWDNCCIQKYPKITHGIVPNIYP